jgi:hypothetical protein
VLKYSTTLSRVFLCFLQARINLKLYSVISSIDLGHFFELVFSYPGFIRTSFAVNLGRDPQLSSNYFSSKMHPFSLSIIRALLKNERHNYLGW